MFAARLAQTPRKICPGRLCRPVPLLRTPPFPSRFPPAPVRAMHIQSIPMWVGSSDNYAYLVVDEASKDAVIIDPAHPEEVAPVLQKAIAAGDINLTAIVNTHHHWDHAGGNDQLRTLLGRPDLPVIGGKDCQSVGRTPADGAGFQLGGSGSAAVNVTALYTPCHTQDSICWLFADAARPDQPPAVFTGDTLFHGGCGRFFEGSAAEMHRALNTTLAALPAATAVYPGHEYTRANAAFALSVLPRSAAVQRLAADAAAHAQTQGRYTLADEKAHNVFMRVADPDVQAATGATEPVAVMAKLREMKNNFKG